MKQTHNVEIGITYNTKRKGKTMPVRIESKHPDGGWKATSHRRLSWKSGAETVKMLSIQRHTSCCAGTVDPIRPAARPWGGGLSSFTT